MRLSFNAAALGLLLAAAPAFAEDKPKPNTLTPKEIADGWILLFDGETTFGWKIDGAAEVKDGALVLGKGKKTVAYPTSKFGSAFQYKMEANGSAKVVSRIGYMEYDSPRSSYWQEFHLTEEPNGGRLGGSAGNSTLAGGGKSDRKELATGDLVIETDGKTDFAVRSVKVRPLNTKPLFDGKTLDGWKVNAADPKRMASKWEVTRDGELSLKNGPGDLVCEKEFDNFVLQLECKTLGKNLNSGVFFRCIPGQYQNGYEAQIHNGFKGDDRTKPVDFGTGAIYRRVPARKVVSNDNEWFTMTVVADGKHIATWVNGYQTVDWTDDRKENDNPRNGFRAAKGPISLQGHDPTTDLLFRNIRIAELGGEKK